VDESTIRAGIVGAIGVTGSWLPRRLIFWLPGHTSRGSATTSNFPASAAVEIVPSGHTAKNAFQWG